MDGIGNPVGLITDFALSSYTYTFDPYGAANLTAGGTGNGAAQNPYLFTAGIQDRATGLVKFGLRWYNPTAGAWTQQDTLDAPLDPANANRYGYAGGDPINGSDPAGRLAVELVAKLIAAGFEGYSFLDSANGSGEGFILGAIAELGCDAVVSATSAGSLAAAGIFICSGIGTAIDEVVTESEG